MGDENRAGTDGCRDASIFQDVMLLDEDVVRFPASTRFLRPLMTTELLSIVERQVTDLFHGCEKCKKLETAGHFAKRPGRSEDAEIEVIAQLLHCLERWEGGSLEGVPEELKPRYRQTMKRQIAELLDRHLPGSSADVELGETAATTQQLEVPDPSSVSNLVQAWESSIKSSQLSPTMEKLGELEAIRTSASHDTALAANEGTRRKPEDKIQPGITDIVPVFMTRQPEVNKNSTTADIVPVFMTRQPEVNKNFTTADIAHRSLEREPESKLQVVVDIIQGTGSPRRKSKHLEKQPDRIDIVHTFALLKEEMSVQECGIDDSFSDNERNNLCFCIWKSKSLRRLMCRVLRKLPHRTPNIPLPIQVHRLSKSAKNDCAVDGAVR